jgi:hypothetical protein
MECNQTQRMTGGTTGFWIIDPNATVFGRFFGNNDFFYLGSQAKFAQKILGENIYAMSEMRYKQRRQHQYLHAMR